MKLYRVILSGMQPGFMTGSPSYGVSYVVAMNTDEAYKKVRTFLSKNDLGFTHERRLNSIELIADESQYGDSSTMLYL